MSEAVGRLAVLQLRTNMFPKLPQSVQQLFSNVTDSFSGQSVPNIVLGEYQDFGVNVPTPMITVHCEGPQEGMVNVWRHLKLFVDIWLGSNVAPNVNGRTTASIIYQYVNAALQNVNWSGRWGAGADFVQIERCFEAERSSILFDNQKTYHIANVYNVEALSRTWY